MTLIPLYILLYGLLAGITFRGIANMTDDPTDPWLTPGPFFGSLLWPIALPMMIGIKTGTLVLGDGSGSRDERRREKELTEARHKLEVAKVEAATTRELERALEK